MKIAVFGQTGQVASELQRRTPEGVELQVLGRDRVDFAVPEDVFAVASALTVDAVINAVAYTAVDKAEEEEALANAVNGTSVKALAQACAETDTPLVHISTDYVFDGSGETPWQPGDPTNPLGVYGHSKLLGEQGIGETQARAAILRTSWVFSSHGSNFVKTMLRLSAERDRLSIVADQIGGPTPAAAIADACLTLAKNLYADGATGMYHFAGAPDVSWADFAREIFAQSGLSPDVVDIPTSEFPTPAQRPSNSRLDCGLIQREHGVPRPDWRAGLRDVLTELGPRI